MAIGQNSSAAIDYRHDINALNKLFKPLSIIDRINKLYDIFDTSEVLMTSSFGTHSVGIIHLINQVNKSQKIHFINTGYLFNETIAFKNELQTIYNLDVIELEPDKVQHKLTTEESWWIQHPRMCCSINKIDPLSSIIPQHSIWISGLMSFQTKWRSKLDIFERKGDIIKFHPMIDLTEEDYKQLKFENKLLDHPLEVIGYGSVGCTHCTIKGEGRTGRWKTSGKTECGLHQNYFYKKS